ncbi:N-acetylmuramoyl-L-alanine amidase [Bryocella elongata]|nr:N-acetylmuramoyl-L-alanine amidase [Bryocella elongata]
MTRKREGWRRWSASGVLAASCAMTPAGILGQPPAAAHAHPDAWTAAIRARRSFEGMPPGSHRKPGYGHLILAFQAIYHNDPGGPHAAAAVAQVAELFAEEGREFHDKHEFVNAARQYQYLAKAYPGGDEAPAALGHAAEYLGPAFANDPRQAAQVRAELVNDYPGSREARALRHDSSASVPNPPVPAPVPQAPAPQAPVERVAEQDAPPPPSQVLHHKGGSDIPLATLTSIRHWSTSDYTRVAIDLGADVEYEAARVESPTRIFFDLHHTHLAPGIEGHNFNVTDDGFLTRIRAAQYNADTVRVVLDVHRITDFSAFLLPNPDRLIIDIHGRKRDAPPAPAAAGASVPPPITQSQVTQPQPAQRADLAGSSLPPMPVTDGSEGFGLPSGGSRGAVARPRVVVASEPTAARPVPNTISTSSSATSAEVAAVSSQPGKMEATRRPTSKPVAAKSSVPDADVELSEQAGPHVAGRPTAAPPPAADGQTSLMRALGLKIGRIVIDAGHGGHDSGTLGAGGIEEKDVVLDVALRLGKLLHDRLGTEVVYTRASDTFVPLETRTAIANKAQADLFISIHANSSADKTVRGVEVYYLNFTNDAEAMRVAARENAVSTQSVHQLSELVEKIALKDKVEESRDLAADVDSSLYGGLTDGNAGLRNRGVKKAPFVVLIGANMPSILAEISFVTNKADAAELRNPAYRQRVAESLYRGVAQYAGAVNGATPAPASKSAHLERASAPR